MKRTVLVCIWVATVAGTFWIGTWIGTLNSEAAQTSHLPSQTEKLARQSGDQAPAPADPSVPRSVNGHQPTVPETRLTESNVEPDGKGGADLVEVPLRFIGKFNIGILTGSPFEELGISPKIVEFLGISDVEKGGVESLLTNLRNKFRNYESGQVRLISDGGLSEPTVLEMSVSDKFGGEMSASLRSGLTEILGADRGLAFEKLAEAHLELLIGRVGYVKRLTFNPQPDGEFKVDISISDGSRFRAESTNGQLPASVAHLARLVDQELEEDENE